VLCPWSLRSPPISSKSSTRVIFSSFSPPRSVSQLEKTVGQYFNRRPSPSFHQLYPRGSHPFVRLSSGQSSPEPNYYRVDLDPMQRGRSARPISTSPQLFRDAALQPGSLISPPRHRVSSCPRSQLRWDEDRFAVQNRVARTGVGEVFSTGTLTPAKTALEDHQGRNRHLTFGAADRCREGRDHRTNGP